MSVLAAAIITHTTRHLRRTLLGVACSRRRADLVVVSCDGDGADLRDAVGGAAAEFGVKVTLVRRAHTGDSRSGQVRNNAVRAMIEAGVPEDARVVFLDGDCSPAVNCFEQHVRLGASGGAIVGFRIDLTPQQTDTFDESAVKRGEPPARIEPAQLRMLRERQTRYERALFWKRFGLGKSHKPKILSANFSCTLGAYRSINGFDEEFVGWGAEDDDLGRRLYRAGTRGVVGIDRCMVFHQWHATRAPGVWHNIAGATRFRMKTPVRAAHGVENPLPQPPILVERLGDGA
jgi:hypothetical protein